MTLFASMCNQPQRLAEALAPARAILVAQPPVARWGVGYIQGGEVLLVRNPRLSPAPVDLFAAVVDTPSDCVIGQAVAETLPSAPSNENTPPFRFRRWMFAQQSTARAEGTEAWPQLVERLPDYLKRNLRGRTTAEMTFHVMLAMLHDLGALDEANLPLATTRRTLGAALALVSSTLAKAGVGAEDGGALGNAVVSNGRSLAFARAPGGVALYLRRLWVKGERSERDDTFRGVLLLSKNGGHPGEGFEEVPAGSAVLVSRDLRVDIAPLEG